MLGHNAIWLPLASKSLLSRCQARDGGLEHAATVEGRGDRDVSEGRASGVYR